MSDSEQNHFHYDPYRQSHLEDGGPSQPVTPPNGLTTFEGETAPTRGHSSRQHSYMLPSSNATLFGSTTDVDIEGQQASAERLVENAIDVINGCTGKKEREGRVLVSFSPEYKSASSSSLDESNMTLKERFHHFTWAWYTSCMSTGGVAILLHVVPHKFNGIEIIGRFFYIIQLIIFVGILFSLIYRFVSFPGTFTRSITHHAEGLFMPTIFIAFATMLSNARIYGGAHCGPWLDTLLR
ncbi:hypothetical protein KEM54_006836, partial [Ascosphaera aggregata]